MVYYLTFLSCACIGIAGASLTTTRSASAKEHLHHPRGKLGSEDGRRRSCNKATATGCPMIHGRPTRPRPGQPEEPQPMHTTAAERPTRHRMSDTLQPPDDRTLPEIWRRLSREETSKVRRPPDDRTTPTLPVRSRAFGLVPLSHLPFRGLDYK